MYHFLENNEVEHFSICLLSHWVFSCVTFLFWSFAHFGNFLHDSLSSPLKAKYATVR